MTAMAHDIGNRLAWMLRQIYPQHTSELVARDVDCEPRTVKDWLAGKCPSGGHLAALCKRYGRAFTDFVIFAPTWADNAKFEAELHAQRVRLELLQDAYEREKASRDA